MNKRLLVFTVLLTVILSLIALRGRQHRAPETSSGPATAPLSADSESQGMAPAARLSSEDVKSASSGDVNRRPSQVDGPSNVSEMKTSPPGNVPNPAVSVQPPVNQLGRAGTPTLRRLVVTFDDIPCPGHIRTIIDAMARVQGVSDVSILYDESRGEIDYDPTLATPEAIVDGMPPDCPARILEDKPGT